MKRELIVAALALAGVPACGADDRSRAQAAANEAGVPADDGAVPAAPAAIAALPGGKAPRTGVLPATVYAAGQPAAAQWRGVADAGVRTVVNLRPDAELDGRDERAETAAVGLRYVHIPIAGAGDITPENADRLWRLLGEAREPVLVHCASGNRVGALLALGAARAGLPAEQAIALGRDAGLAGAEAVVRERIAAPAR